MKAEAQLNSSPYVGYPQASRLNLLLSLAHKLGRRWCQIDASSSPPSPKQALKKHDLSARVHTRDFRIARTIADLNGDESIGTGHLAEAINLRFMDRENGTLV